MKITFIKNIWEQPQKRPREPTIHPDYFELPAAMIAKLEKHQMVKSKFLKS
jgi:hypothetical protein